MKTRRMKATLVLWFGGPARFRDGRHGRLTEICVDPDSRTVTGLTISNSLRGDQSYVPTGLVTAAFPDRIHVNQRWDSMTPDPGPRGIRLTRDEPVRWEGANRLRARLKGVIVHGETRGLQAFVVAARARGPLFRLAASQVTEITDAVVSVRQNTPPLRLLPRYRPDDDIQADILREMKLESLLFPQDVQALRADVTDGAARVRGNVHTSRTRRNLVDKARRVAGVLSVADELVEDQALELAVAAALARDPATRSLDIYVFARAGEIELAGKALNEEAAGLAIATAAAVPGVRSVRSSLVWPRPGQPVHAPEFRR